jgi:hypothetical protein
MPSGSTKSKGGSKGTSPKAGKGKKSAAKVRAGLKKLGTGKGSDVPF